MTRRPGQPAIAAGLDRILPLGVAGLLGIAGLLLVTSNLGRPSTSAGAPVLSVFAAASLGRALTALGPAYEREAGTLIQASTDSSVALRVQIEQGAAADVFLSADTRNPDALATAGLIDGAVVPFARNGLAILVPANNPAGIRSLADLGRPGVKVIAAGDSVPISRYATEAVTKFVASGDAGPQFAAAYAANIVSREDNVSAVVTKIQLGEGDAAIVYATDAAGAGPVLIIPMPSGANVVATYGAVVPTTALHRSGGHAFLDWLTGPSGQRGLAALGFSPLR